MLIRLMKRVFNSMGGRRTRWRLGRSIYMTARTDGPNDMDFNGEKRLLLELLSSHIHESRKLVLFDVGANVGEWTRAAVTGAHAASITDRVEVHAFEPVDTTFEILRENLSNIPAGSNVILVNKAMSDQEGSTDIFVFGEGGGTNSLHSDKLAPETSKRTIQLTTLDQYCHDHLIEYVHFAKCDTEGHDVNVLRGATELLKQERLMVFQFEYNHRWVYSRHYLKDVFDLMEHTRYRIGKVVPDGIELFQEWHPEMERFFEGNYIILHETALERLSVSEGRFDSANTYDTD